MREIKFRAWDGEQMHKAFDLTQNPIYWWKDNFDYPLMQYTGLKDKNGVEIYEGDILSSSGGYGGDLIGSVYWGVLSDTDGWSHGAYQCWVCDGESLFDLAGANSDASCEVIGNIYENPELLEQAA